MTQQSKKKIRKYCQLNENRITRYQNLRGVSKAVLRGKIYSTIQYYLLKSSQINDLSLHHKKLRKEGQIKPNRCKRKEIIKI